VVGARGAGTDARLSDLVFSWCVQHAQRISGSRLTALVREAAPDVRSAAESFLGELSGAGVRWVRGPSPPVARPRERRAIEVALERPALLRLRMRALAGVGGRADVLVALLATPAAWTSAAQLGEVGLAKRNVARVLAELAEAGIASARRRGNVREFRLARPGALGDLVALPRDVVFPDWRAVFDWVYLADELVRLPTGRPATRQVEGSP
jgi:DNA-binding transcriptional ArsR family regulator